MTGTSQDRGYPRGPAHLASFHVDAVHRSWLPALLLAAAACSAEVGTGASADREAVVATTSDSAGITIVTSEGPGWGLAEAWSLEPDLQVGELDGPLAFGRINWVSPGPGDGMLVLDGQSHLVHVFDSTGRHLREFGGEGDGPGEFRNPAVVTPVTGNRVAVGQGFPPVLHWLDLDGVYLHSTRLPGARSEAGNRTAGTFGAWQVTPAGTTFAQVQVIDPSADGGEMPAALLHLPSGENATPDTVAEWTWRTSFGDSPFRMLEPIHTWMPSGNGVVVAPGAPYEYREYSADGTLRRIVRRAVEPLAVTDEHRTRALDDFRENMESGGAPQDFIDQMIDRAEFGSTVPDVMRVWVSEPDGHVWIGVYDQALAEAAPEPTGITTNAWDVFAPDGTYQGRIPVPDGFRLTVVTADVLYGVWEDELEVPFARRYRIVRSDERGATD